MLLLMEVRLKTFWNLVLRAFNCKTKLGYLQMKKSLEKENQIPVLLAESDVIQLPN